MSTKTTIRLTIPTTPLVSEPTTRALFAALLGIITLLALAFSTRVPQAATQEVAPQIVRPAIVYIIATPTPQPLPTIAPTPQPEIVYQTVEVPVEVPIYISSAPVVDAAPPTYAPPTVAPAVIGEVISWDGEVQQIAP